MWSWLFLAFLGGLFWFWFDSLRSYEIAKGVCQEMCHRYEVQLLDSTITLQHTRIYRKSWQNIQLERDYTFDFSTTGAEREQGQVVMRGTKMVFFELPGRSGGIILPV
jgi:hypothetical protein